MTAGPLVIDVAHEAHDANVEPGIAALVLVEPLRGVPAVALALDAGWGSVELAPELDGAPPMPLVSFEQPPPPEHRGGRCRVRCDDLHAAAQVAVDAPLVLLGAPAVARPLCARLASADLERVVLVPARCRARAGDDRTDGADGTSADSWWACGMLLRVLLEELDQGGSVLTDAAGIAVTLARGAEDAASQLAASMRWRRHLARGGHADDLRLAAAVDSVASVPRLRLDGATWVATAWDPPLAS